MTVVTLRPDATVSAGGAAFTGGASYHAVTSDDSDSSYATAGPGTGATLTLGTTTLGTGVTKQVRVRVRHRTASSSGAIQAFVRQAGVTLAAINSANSTTTIVTTTGSYAAVALTQGQVDDLRVVLNNVSGVDERFIEAYVDLVVAAIPVVDVLEPSGTVTTSKAAVSWDFTSGSDGGPQQHYWIRVFSAAQYGAGGFDPEFASADLFNSGVVASGSNSETVGPIPDGTNHRAYVRVSQVISGQQQWSAWDFIQFTVNTSPPTVQSITPVANNSAGSITVTVARNTGGNAWTAVEVQRSTDGGNTWEFVRGASGADTSNDFATFAADTFTVTDYEAPNGVSVLYRARASMTSGTVVSPWVTSSAVVWSSMQIWLKSASAPAGNALADPTVRPDTVRERRQGVFPVLNRSDPIVVSDVLQLATGSIVFQAETASEAADLEAILEEPIQLLQMPAVAGIADMWLVFGNVSRRFLSPMIGDQSRQYEATFTQVGRPPDAMSTLNAAGAS